MKLITAIFVLLLFSQAAASSNEATGRVTHIADGDTFDVQMQDHDSRITEDLVRSLLLNNFVYLDLDDKTGKDQFGRWLAVVYLADSDGTLNLSRNFNRVLVDSGHAVIEDFRIMSLILRAGGSPHLFRK